MKEEARGSRRRAGLSGEDDDERDAREASGEATPILIHARGNAGVRAYGRLLERIRRGGKRACDRLRAAIFESAPSSNPGQEQGDSTSLQRGCF